MLEYNLKPSHYDLSVEMHLNAIQIQNERLFNLLSTIKSFHAGLCENSRV